MEKKKKRRRHRGLGFLILVMGVLIVCGVYQYREYGNIKDVMLKLIGQDPVIYQHVSEEIGEMDGKFYYQQLSEEEQTVYQELLQGLLEHVEQIHVHSHKPERVNELLVYVLNDYPEIFWSDGTASSTAYSGLQNYTSVMPGYLYTKEECEKKKTQIDMEVSECLSVSVKIASDYEKVLYDYEYIVNRWIMMMQQKITKIFAVYLLEKSQCVPVILKQCSISWRSRGCSALMLLGR